MSGPALYISAPFEFIGHIYDLQEKQLNLVIHDVLTRDMVPATVEIAAAHALDIHRRGRVGERPLLPAEEALLAALPYRMPNWEDTSKAVIERAVREVVSRERLSDLLSVTHYNAIGGRIQGVANNSTRQWGVRIDTLIVKCIQPKPDVTAATERRWMADTDAETTITREQGEAEAMRNTLQTIAEGYEAARASGMAPNEIQREVLHHILEQFARDPLSKVQLTPELNAFIRGLAR